MAHTDESSAVGAPTTPPHIAIVSTHFAPETTGNAPYATGLAQGLASRGFRVSVVAGAPHYPEWRVRDRSAWASEEHAANLSIRRVTSYVPRQPSFLRRMVYEVLFGLKFGALVPADADALLLVSPSLFASAMVRVRVSLRRARPRTILWTQDLYSAGLTETPGRITSILGKVMAMIEGALARSCDAMVVIHPRFARYALEHFGVASDRLTVIRNWTHVYFDEDAIEPGFRAEHGWSAEEIIVLHAGNMGAKQGLDNVVQAARLAEQQKLPVRFVLVGDGNQRARLKALAQGCRSIEFVAPLSDEEFQRALAAADILLVNERPSLNEAAVPSKLTSYFATGKPIVAATDATSTTSEEILASRAGVVVPPTQPQALVEAAMTLAEDWGREQAQAGPAFVARNLTADAAFTGFGSLLEELLVQQQGPAPLVDTHA